VWIDETISKLDGPICGVSKFIRAAFIGQFRNYWNVGLRKVAPMNDKPQKNLQLLFLLFIKKKKTLGKDCQINSNWIFLHKLYNLNELRETKKLK